MPTIGTRTGSASVNEPPAAGVGLAGGVLLPIMAPPQGGLVLFVYILLRNVTKWRVTMKATFRPEELGRQAAVADAAPEEDAGLSCPKDRGSAAFASLRAAASNWRIRLIACSAAAS